MLTSHQRALRNIIVLSSLTMVLLAPAFGQRMGVLPAGSSTNAGIKVRSGTLLTTDMTVLTPVQLAQSLVGPNVTISNVVYNGSSQSAGTFLGGAAPIGFEYGIILSSGDIASVVGPNTNDATSTDTGTAGDPTLSAMAGHPTFNATSIDFDFEVAGGTQLVFQYVFSSEEYNEWVHTQYNDIFAFFLNGQNIALLPDTNPVSVNNVNCGNPYAPPQGENCALYINNSCVDLPAGSFPCAGAVDLEMDGLTVVLTAVGTLLPGSNHIRLIVADAGDPVYDTNVFIRAQSFTGGNPGPFFDTPTPCGNILHATVGVPFAYDVVAKAATGLPSNAVTLSSAALPSGALHQPELPVSGFGQNATAASRFHWTPQASDIGTHFVDYVATDQLSQTRTCRVTVVVENPTPMSGQDYLIIGFSPFNGVIAGSNGRVLLNTADFVVMPVTPQTLPEWFLPPQAFGYRLYAQFGNYDPVNYPNEPILMSNGLEITIGVGWLSYGPTNMGIVALLEDPPLIFEEVSFDYEVERE